MEYFLGRLNEQLSDQSQFKLISGTSPLDPHAAPPLRLTPGDLCYFLAHFPGHESMLFNCRVRGRHRPVAVSQVIPWIMEALLRFVDSPALPE